MKFRFVIAVCLTPLAAAAQAGPLARVGWLAGCWELRAPNRVTLEMWMPPLGDMVLGASRTTVGTTTSEFEQLRMKTEADRVVYTSRELHLCQPTRGVIEFASSR